MKKSEIIINNGYSGFNPVQFGFEKCLPAKCFGPAVRTYWLLHYVVSGTGIFQREGKKYPVTAGEVFVIPPFLETFYQADCNDPWTYIWIAFETDEELPEVFHSPVIQVAGMGRIFEDMRRCQTMQNGKSAFLASRIWELIALVLESGKKQIDCIDKALHCIHSEYMNDLTVSNLAKRFNLDRCYFSTLFTRKVGVSPSTYLIHLRLEKAAELMLYHNESPTIAALSVGYSDLYHFSKSFKKKYGCSPRAYVKGCKVEKQ
ncbi:MAG: AraC family transcriptional regulator [Clostridia bacterium]|nr:AraC family transcriptional regulator [Clostridia bacterium]